MPTTDTVVATRWVRLMTKGGREQWIAEQVQADARLVFRIPYGADIAAITAKWRLRKKGSGRVFEIQSIELLEDLRREWEAVCTEVPAGA